MSLDIEKIRTDTPGVDFDNHLMACGAALMPRAVTTAVTCALALGLDRIQARAWRMTCVTASWPFRAAPTLSGYRSYDDLWKSRHCPRLRRTTTERSRS